jgi:UDP-glucuronate 4-epimerase
MKILVTGVGGFIGYHVAQRLVNELHLVIGIDNLNDYYNVKLKEINIKSLKMHDNFVFHNEDIRETKVIEEFKPDKVIHLAAMAGVRYSLQNPTLYCNVNVEGTVNLLEQAKNNDVKLFVYASSSSVYGNKSGMFSETDVLNPPESMYAATKRAKEMMADLYHRLYGLRVIGLRFFTVYGPRGRPDMAPRKFMERIMNGKKIDKYGDGSSYRSYTYIDDIVDGVIGAFNSDLENEVINLGNDSVCSLNEFIEIIENVTKRKAYINQMGDQKGDVKGTYANIDKARKLINFNPKTNLEKGLGELYKYLCEIKDKI